MIASEFDVFELMFDMFELMFDVIFSEAKKFPRIHVRLRSKPDKQGPLLDVLMVVQVMIEGRHVKPASTLNLQSRIHVKPAQKQRSSRAIMLNYAPIFLAPGRMALNRACG